MTLGAALRFQAGGAHSAGQPAGTLWGEIMRNSAQFEGFPEVGDALIDAIAHLLTTGRRHQQEGGRPIPRGGGRNWGR